jgi:hypothetical protein
MSVRISESVPVVGRQAGAESELLSGPAPSMDLLWKRILEEG